VWREIRPSDYQIIIAEERRQTLITRLKRGDVQISSRKFLGSWGSAITVPSPGILYGTSKMQGPNLY
jgi:hypothetical protein